MGCSGSSARHVLTSDTASIRLFLRVPYRSIGMHSLCTAIFLSPAFLATPNSTVPHSSRPLLDRSTLLSECTSFPGVLPRYKVLPSFLTPRLSVYSADSISAPPPEAFYLPSVTLVSRMLYCLLTDHLFGFGCSEHGRLLLADL